jgi:hypothetical protein
MKKRLVVLLTAGCGLLCGAETSSAQAPAAVMLDPQAGGEPRLHISARPHKDGFIVQFKIPGFQSGRVIRDGETYDAVRLPGAQVTMEPGKPCLPVWHHAVPMPNGAGATVRILKEKVQVIEGVNVLPYYDVFPSQPDLDLFEKDDAVYGADAFYPAERCVLSAPVILNEERHLPLTVYPFRFNPVTRQLEVCTELRLEITFEGTDARNAAPPRRKAGPSWHEQKPKRSPSGIEGVELLTEGE